MTIRDDDTLAQQPVQNEPAYQYLLEQNRRLTAELARLRAVSAQALEPLEAAQEPARPSQYGSPELQSLILARAIEKDKDRQPAQDTDGYVQQVPDKCDRIVWRGSYYHLPLSEQPAQQSIEHCLWARNGNTPCPHTTQPGKPWVDSGLSNRYTASTVAKCDSRKPEQPAQQQEPVAVYVGDTWCGSVVRLYEDLPLETPLYTSPPASKPMTPEQRKAIVVCFTSGKVSVSEVQRQLAISYSEAHKLCQSIVDLGMAEGLQLSPSLERHGITVENR